MRPLMLEPEKEAAEAIRGLVDILQRLLLKNGRASLGAEDGHVYVVGPEGEHVEVPTAVVRLLECVADDFSYGQGVAVVPIHELLTTTEAAELLNVSRPYLTRLLDQGVLPFERVGTHRRVPLSDVLAYREEKDKTRRAALEKMVREGEELGLEY